MDILETFRKYRKQIEEQELLERQKQDEMEEAQDKIRVKFIQFGAEINNLKLVWTGCESPVTVRSFSRNNPLKVYRDRDLFMSILVIDLEIYVHTNTGRSEDSYGLEEAKDQVLKFLSYFCKESVDV